MLAVEVAQLVADVEVQRPGTVGQCVHHFRIEDNEVAPEESCGERVEDAVAVDEVRLRGRVYAQAFATVLHALVQVRHLRFRNLYPGTLEVGDKRGVDKQVADVRQQKVDQRDAESAQHQDEPEGDRDNESNTEERTLLRIDKRGHEVFPKSVVKIAGSPPGFCVHGRLRTTGQQVT
jgi:hypothetical protein